MTGARAVGHALMKGKRRGVKHVAATMRVGGGMGAAALFEVTSSFGLDRTHGVRSLRIWQDRLAHAGWHAWEPVLGSIHGSR